MGRLIDSAAGWQDVAASILTAIFHMLKDARTYQDLGHNHFDRRGKERQKNRLVTTIDRAGLRRATHPLPA